jgi:hypothetical protein
VGRSGCGISSLRRKPHQEARDFSRVRFTNVYYFRFNKLLRLKPVSRIDDCGFCRIPLSFLVFQRLSAERFLSFVVFFEIEGVDVVIYGSNCGSNFMRVNPVPGKS